MCRSLPEAVSLEEDISTGPHKPIPIPASSKLAEAYCETVADSQTVMDWRRPPECWVRSWSGGNEAGV